MLRLLAERPGQVFSRLEIMEELWQSEFSGDVRACDVHISNLRQKIEQDPQDPELVVTVRGVGYKLARRLSAPGGSAADPSRNGRYAPSPTGELHLGNLRTALLAWLFARSAGASFAMRIDDLDEGRVRERFVASQLDDLRALGRLGRGAGTAVERAGAYAAALGRLAEQGRVFRCFCTRREVREAASAQHGELPEGFYRGPVWSCRRRSRTGAPSRAIRLRCGCVRGGSG